MKIKIGTFYSYLYASIIFLYSLYFLPYLTKGDQYAYRKFYNECFPQGSSLKQQLVCYQGTLSSQEPVYFVISKIFNQIVSKDLLIATTNAIAIFFLIKLIYRYHQRSLIHIFIFFVLTNYYTTVLLFSAERLKFAIIFLLLSIYYSHSKLKSSIFRVLMLFSHLQTILIQISTLFLTLLDDKSFKSKKHPNLYKSLSIIGASCLTILVYIVLKNQLTSKFAYYSQSALEDSSIIVGFLKSSIFVIATYISTRKKQAVIFQLPLLFSTLVLGGDRIVIFIVMVYFATTIYYNRKPDFIMYIFLTYFSIKTLEFIENTFKYGTGFLINT